MVAMLRSCGDGSGEQGLREQRIVGADEWWLARSLLRTPAPMVVMPPAVVILGEAEVVDVDEGGGVLDAVLHQVDEVGAAAEELGSGCGDGVDGVVGGGGALVGEGIHARLLARAARTAATMLG